MKKRIITALIMAVVLIPLLILGNEFFLLVGLFATYMAGYELLNMFSKKQYIFIFFNSKVAFFQKIVYNKGNRRILIWDSMQRK